MTETVYRSIAADTIRAVQFDELTLVYHRASGITHVLAPPAPEILDALAGESMTRAGLLSRLGDEFDLGDADPDALLARLDELVAAGLVERG